MNTSELIDGRFRIERLAGRGGMGEVYRALDEVTGEPVALKRLHRHGESDLARFEREVTLLAGFDDPRIVRYVAHGAYAELGPYVVMEWLEGEDLATRLRSGRMAASDALTLVGALAEALAVLHGQGVVHRDLKPSNVFLVDGRVDRLKLLDFGIAQVDATTRMTMPGAIVGTAGYMAPEQVRSAQPVDSRADVFALGCILFECLSGEPAFQGAQILALITKILLDDPPDLLDRCPGAPPALATLLDQMLSKVPAARPKDGRVVAERISALPAVPAVPLERVATPPGSEQLTESEQRAMALILVGRSAPGSVAPSESTPGSAPDASDEAWLEGHSADHAASFERLLDGSAALVLWSAQVATDLAARAALCALGIARRLTGRPICLAMGRSPVTGRLPVGAAIDRAAQLMLTTSSESPATATWRISGEVALDEVAAGLLDGRFELRREADRVWLSRERDLAGTRQVLGRDTPCVGRERELRALEVLFEDCVGDSGGAQVALVTGPPGVGKSRLAHELLTRLTGGTRRPAGRTGDAGVVVLSARADLNRAGSAFALAAGLVRSAAGLLGDEDEQRQDKLAAVVATAVPPEDQTRVSEFMGELIGIRAGASASLPLRAARRDPLLMNEQLRRAFRELLVGLCTRSPLLLILEDLHWADLPSLQLLDELICDLEDAPLFVLALARNDLHDSHPGLWSARFVQEYRLRELPAKASERLIRHVLGQEADLEVVDRIVRLSEGNAFYLEELIRASAAGSASTDLPETVVAMVQSRLSALADDERRTLRAAAVFGETCWSGGISALLGGTSVGPVLGRLVDRELLVRRPESRLPGQREVAFRHALLREGAYAMLTDEDRVLGHRLAAAWLEEHGEDDPFVLAEHFERGNDPEQAAECYLRAAERAGLAGDTLGAIACIRRGLGCASPGELRQRLLGLSCQVHYNRVDILEQALGDSTELLGSARPGSAPWAQAMLVDLTAAVKAGRMDDFQRAASLVLATEFEAQGLDPASLTLATICYLLELGGVFAGANQAFARFEALVENAGDDVPSVTTLYYLYDSLRSGHMYQDPFRGLRRAREARELATAIGHRKYATMAVLFEALNRWYLGDNAGASRAALSLDGSADESGFASATRPFLMAWLLADSGQLDDARGWAEKLVAAGQSKKLMLDEARGQWVLAEVLRRAGARSEARTAIDVAVGLFRVICPLDLSGALATSAALHLDSGDVSTALAVVTEAAASAAQIGACSQFHRGAFLSRLQVDVLLAAGRPDAAAAVQAAAASTLRATAALIDEVGLRESFTSSVRDHRRLLGALVPRENEPSSS